MPNQKCPVYGENGCNMVVNSLLHFGSHDTDIPSFLIANGRKNNDFELQRYDFFFIHRLFSPLSSLCSCRRSS